MGRSGRAQIGSWAVRRSANLAEGTARRGSKELRGFVEIALGSLSEVDYLLTLGRDVGAISPEEQTLLRELVHRAGRLTGGLHRALRKRAS
jgi:four helix bundle protein